MDVNKNSYTFGFAAIMVIVVATLLSVAAISLKPFQDKNVELEKKQNILNSVGIEVEREAAAEAYELYISESFVVNHLGERVEGDAFILDLAKEIKKEVEAQVFPIFINEKDGVKLYILPMRGKGLWGPIWGYVALQEDLNTVFGAVFDHKGETPGLGAEIKDSKFQAPFSGKTIYEGESLVSIEVVKGGASEGDMHGVDGISGGTITSDGVTDMLQERLSRYVPFFEELRKEFEVESVLDSLATDSLAVDTLNTIQ
jgi:Na+-transporting NADH:ubiquinone oxidoreductase subunit C